MKHFLLPTLILLSGCSLETLIKTKNNDINKNTVEKNSPQKTVIKKAEKDLTLYDHIFHIEREGIDTSTQLKHIAEVKRRSDSDPNAMFYMGALHEDGKLLPLSHEKARFFYQNAANKNHALARYYLALMLMEGKGGAKDLEGAEALLRQNHAIPHPPSSYSLAHYYFMKGDVENTIMIMESDHITINKNNEYLLAIAYLQANKNIDKAISLLTSSADNDHKEAHHTLATIYHHGLHNINKDLPASYFHYSQAAKDNDPKALYHVAHLAFTYPSLISNNYESALNKLILSAKKNYAPATFHLAKLYDQGYQVKQDYKKALYWYKKSAQLGNNKAMYNLASMYANGDGVTESAEKATFWLEQSAKNGNQRAVELLAQP